MNLRAITRQQWITLFAAQAGYMLDAMDVLLFVFTINVLRAEFHLSAAQAGLINSFTLAFSAAGGIVFGVLSDRIGRARALMWSVLIFSLASAGTALSWNLASLLFWRALIGIGLGAEWSTGAVLVDKLGRRPAFVCYVLAAAILTPIYGATRDAHTLLLLGPAIGFFGTGFFSLFGVMLAELYPTRVRGAGLGFVYNIGRGCSALAPWTVGYFADHYGIGTALGLNSAFFALGAVLIFTLPETKKAELN